MEKLKKMSVNLKKVGSLNKRNPLGEDEYYLAAIELMDIEESVNELSKLIPGLYLESLNKEDVEDALIDIGEELRHILYHIKNSVYYEYLNEY